MDLLVLGLFTSGFSLVTCTRSWEFNLILGGRDESTFLEVKKYSPDEGMSDDYNLYFWLRDHTVVSPVNPNESFHSSFRLIRFKRATKAVNRSIRTMMYSIALVLWERRLIPEFVA